MAYIGQGIKEGTFAVLDTSGNTYNGSNVTFSLGTQVGSPAQLLVSHDGVIQKPGTDYSLASGGTQITFSTAPASGASIFIVEISGAVGGPLESDLNGAELILDADADTSITADTDDQIDIKVAGADDFQIVANNFKVLSGSTLTIESGGTITNSGTASGFGVALDDITTGDAAATLATSAGDITIDAQGNDTDIVFKGTDGSADTTFWKMDGSEKGSLLPGSATTGIYLGVTSAADSNLLHDYEEGELQNPLYFGNTSTQQTGYASARNALMYIKIGQLVHVQAYLDTDGNSLAGVGAVYLKLPFAITSQSSNSFPTGRGFAAYTNVGDSDEGYMSWYLNAGDTIISGNWVSASGASVNDQVQVNTGSTNRQIASFAFTYKTDA